MISKSNLNKLATMLVALSIILSAFQPTAASAQSGDGIKRQVNAGTGRLSFIGPENGLALSASKALGTSIRPQDPAMSLAKRFAPEFGLKDPMRELSEISKNYSENSRLTVRYQQNHEGVPVMGGELIVNTNDKGDLYSINGEISPDLSLQTRPTIDSAQAAETALQVMAKWYQRTPADFAVSEPELWIYDESLLHSSTRPVELVWRMDVAPTDSSMPVRELVLINAQKGSISLHFNQVDTAWAGRDRYQSSSIPQPVPSSAPSIINYDDLVVDEARSRLYGADKAGNKIDVIDTTDLSVISSYALVYGAAPVSLDLSPDGNELAIAQSGIGFVKFIDLTTDAITEIPSVLSGPSTRVTDVIYGRTGILYALTDKGLHVIDLTITPHAEDATQYVTGAVFYDFRFGTISSDRNTLYIASSGTSSAYESLSKIDISAGLTKPILLKETHLYGTGYNYNDIRLSLLSEEAVLLTAGSVYNTSDLTPKAKNFQIRRPALALPGKNFYVTLYDNTTITPDLLYFFDRDNSHKLSSLSTGVIGTPGAIATTSDGNTLFVSSTGGLAKFTIDTTPPGTPIALPSSNHLYNDLVFDLTRGVIYGTDTSGRIDVINIGTTTVTDSFLLPSGANPKGIDLSPDGSELAIALNGLEKILFIDPETGEILSEVTPQLTDDIYYTNLPFDVIYGRAGRLYSNGNPGSGGIDYIHVIDTSSHAWITLSGILRTGAEFSIRQDNNYLYANQTFSPNNIYVYDIQTDVISQLYQGPHGPVSANKFTIVPDGSKIFTSSGQVWDSIMQSQLGTLEGAPGKLIEYIPNHDLVALGASGAGGDVIKFISPVDYYLVSTYTPSPAGTINEMEVAPDGSKLAVNINNQIIVLNLDPSVSSSILVEAGSNQSAPLLTQFVQPLKAKVVNYLGQPLSGKTVTFTAPASGASGTFADTGINSTTAVTNASGIATSSAFTSNNVNGSYVVGATVPDLAGSADFQLSNGVQIKTYTANNGTTLPGTFLCDQTDPACAAGDSHAKAAHEHAIGTYDFYQTHYGRNSIDNNGMAILSTVHFYSGYANAFWNGTQMVYGDAYGFPLADDVVAHELTHGVTQYESNLFYYYQSGAINESFSDLWGEYYDQSNGQGNDTAGVKWLMGEDVSGLGAIRSMSNPPAFGDPDKMSSPNYYEGPEDNGGVHYNSGVNNKAVYLMVEGGTFNGRTVTALGWERTGAIYYEAQTNLLISGADYSDLYYALQQACSNLIGQHGITSGDCTEVKDAIDAVEMNGQPAPNFNTDAPLCTAAGTHPNITFSDDLESGASNWTFSNGAYTRWQYDSPYGPYTHSGLHSLYADDFPEAITDARAQLVSFVVPNNGFLHFSHAYGFEWFQFGTTYYFDGGVLEYSTNGSTWLDAGSLIDYNGYDGTIYNDWNNPLKGRTGFVGDSHGYIGTRLNLANFAGQTITFRWRMGLDDIGYWAGWWLDDIKVYNCVTTWNISGSVGAADVTLDYGDGSVVSQSDGGYLIQVPSSWSGTVTPTHACYTFTPTERSYNNVPSDQTGQDYSASLNPSADCTEIDVSIGTDLMGTYALNAGQSSLQEYPTANGGPVVVKSNNGASIIASLLQFRRPGTSGGWTGITQTMALTDAQISDVYVFPHYDYSDPTKYNSIQLANFDSIDTNISVEIGGVLRGTYAIPAGGSQNVTFPGVTGGPVVVSSDNGAQIIATLYELKRTGSSGLYTGQTTMMGLPSTQLSDTYIIPRYNHLPQDILPYIVFANADSVTTNVTVTIGGNLMGTYPLAPGQSSLKEYTTANGGPVVIQSDNGASIIASLLQFRRPGTSGGWTGITQTMALTDAQISDVYVFPHYDFSDSTKYNSIQLANFDSIDTNVSVEIGGVLRGTFAIPAGGSQNVTFPGVTGGPVVVSSDNGAQIVVTLYELKRTGSNGLYTGQTTMMGLPWSWLSDTYIIPRYNHIPQDILPYIVFAVP